MNKNEDLGEYIAPVLSVKEKFSLGKNKLDFSISEFWQWSQSDLVENRNRGILAEFIVKKALDIDSSTRLEWDEYDLITYDSIKIEVKSAAYIQSWNQKKRSRISFDIAPKRRILQDNNFSKDLRRNAHVYIFCLLHHLDQNTINPMDLSQWNFFVVSTKELNRKLGDQKSVSPSTIKILEHEECGFLELNDKFLKIKKHCV